MLFSVSSWIVKSVLSPTVFVVTLILILEKFSFHRSLDGQAKVILNDCRLNTKKYKAKQFRFRDETTQKTIYLT